jgi:hypothetical protein
VARPALHQRSLRPFAPSQSGDRLGDESQSLAAALVYSEGLYVFSSSSLGLLNVGERPSAAQHPLLPQSALRTGPYPACTERALLKRLHLAPLREHCVGRY